MDLGVKSIRIMDRKLIFGNRCKSLPMCKDTLETGDEQHAFTIKDAEVRLFDGMLFDAVIPDSQALPDPPQVPSADKNPLETQNMRPCGRVTIAATGFMLNYISIFLAQVIPSLNVM